MNISKQTNDSYAGASMYFDAESNVSSSTYNTMEAMSDDSTVGGDDSRNLNSTLEANVAFPLQELKPQLQRKTAPSPLRAFSKNILQEYRAPCSTPSKEQLLQSVEVNRGSDELCVELHEAFGDMEKMDKLPLSIIINDLADENKENMLPEKSCENSTLSLLSYNEVVTVIDRNKSTISDIKIEANDDTKETKSVEENSKNIAKSQKSRRSMLPSRIARKSLCEPNLNTNRPSRIVATQQNTFGQCKLPTPKTSFAAAHKASAPSSSSDMMQSIPEKVTQKYKRQSVMPTVQAEKRSFQYAHRMSTVVKTTLNSPARKIMRRTVMPTAAATTNTAASTRRSMLTTTRPTIPVPNQIRRSIAPTTSKTTTNTIKTPVIAAAGKTNANIKDVTSSKHTGNINKKQPSANLVFTCTECNEKFRIKSLLDAHKRSHEDGISVFVRKTNNNGSGNSSCNNNNQCKYCDKKFALLRALHIHLLQNCTKIPPVEKRKLEFTEMAHVEKAQLPVFTHSNASSTHTTSNSSLAASKSQSRLGSTDSLANKHDASVAARDLVIALGGLEISPNEQKDHTMAPPSSNKVKKNTAHKGVYRTPTKSVPCHICKLNFKSVLEYTQHSMTKHSQNSKLQQEQPQT